LHLSTDTKSKLKKIGESCSLKDNKFLKLNFKTRLILTCLLIKGIPTIFLVLYTLTLFYKCLCNKRYEEWLKTWSTSHIKRQYKKIHSRSRPTADTLLTATPTQTRCRKRNAHASSSSTSSSESFIHDDNELFSSDSDYESFKVVDGCNWKTTCQIEHKFDNDTLLNKNTHRNHFCTSTSLI